MNLKRRILLLLPALALLSAGAHSVSAQERFDQEPLTIVHQDGRTTNFTVDLAVTTPQRSQGLMYRKNMAPDHGMIFDFFEDRLVTMWMRNTYIPLDMLFVARSGQITHIHRGAVPHDESTISSRGLVRFVVELNAGAVDRYQIKIGDQVQSHQIKKAAR